LADRQRSEGRLDESDVVKIEIDLVDTEREADRAVEVLGGPRVQQRGQSS
jgi:hypothetical protein